MIVDKKAVKKFVRVIIAVITAAVSLSAEPRGQNRSEPLVTYGARGEVIAVTGLEPDAANCGRSYVVGEVTEVVSSGDILDLGIRAPAGLQGIYVGVDELNPSDRQAIISTLLSKGKRVRADVIVCGSGAMMYATSLRAVSPRQSGYPPARKLAWAGRTLADLKRLVGKYESLAALRNPALRRALIGLGLRDLKKIESYLLTTPPVEMVSGDIIISGCLSHFCMTYAVAIAVELPFGPVHAAVLESDVITIYSKKKIFEHLPIGLQNWVSDVIEKAREIFHTRIRVAYH